MEFGFWQVTCAVLIPGILLASWIDITERRVPNWLNLALILSGFAVQFAFFGWTGAATGFWGLLTGFGLLIIPWMMHAMGAGDVKLMAAIGVWIGPMLALYSFALGAVLGGVAGVVMIISARRLGTACANLAIIFEKCTSRATLFSEYGSVKSFGSSGQLLPYGVPLTAGTLVILSAKMFGWWGI